MMDKAVLARRDLLGGLDRVVVEAEAEAEALVEVEVEGRAPLLLGRRALLEVWLAVVVILLHLLQVYVQVRLREGGVLAASFDELDDVLLVGLVS